MMKAGIAILLAASAMIGGVAHAQEAPADSHDPGIVVEGRKESPRKEVQGFVKDSVTVANDQLSPFRDAVCPVVLGLPPAYAKAIQKRLREVSLDAGARVDRSEKCSPNVFVIVAADTTAFIAELREKYHGIFNSLTNDDKHTALDDGPVRAWRLSEVLAYDGAGGYNGPDAPRTFRKAGSMSRISLMTQQAAFGAVVVIDIDVIDDKSVGQIADYAAMRALAGARPPKAGTRTDTILSLFEPGKKAPEGLTEVDRSFLKGVYAMQPNARAGSQIGAIADQILRDARARTEPKRQE